MHNLRRYQPWQICKGKLAALRYGTYKLRTRWRRDQGDTAAAPFHKSPEPHHEHQHGYSTASSAPAQPILAQLVRHASPDITLGTAACTPTHNTNTRYPHWIPTPNPNTTPAPHNSVLSNLSILVFLTVSATRTTLLGLFFRGNAVARHASGCSRSDGLWFGRVDNDMNAMAYASASTCTGMGGLMFRDMPSSGSALRF